MKKFKNILSSFRNICNGCFVEFMTEAEEKEAEIKKILEEKSNYEIEQQTKTQYVSERVYIQ